MAKIDLVKVATAAIAAGASVAASKEDNKMVQADVGAVVAAAAPTIEKQLTEAQAKFDYVTNNESLPASWSFNAAWIAVLSSSITIYGTLADGLQIDKDQTILIGAGGTLISAGLWLVGRIRGKPIGQ